MASGFSSMHANHTKTRALISLYWGAWNSSSAAMGADVAFLNLTLLKVEMGVAWLNLSIASLRAELAGMNATMLASMAALSAKLDGVNATVLSTLASMEATLMARLNSMNTTFFNQLAKVNSSLHAYIFLQMTRLSGNMSGMNASLAARLNTIASTIASDHTEIRAWFDEVLAAVDANLTFPNATLHAHLDEIEASMGAFYLSLNASLAGLRDYMMACCANLTADIELLNETMRDLNDLTLAEISSRLDGIADDLTSHDVAAMAGLAEISANLTAFDATMRTRLNELESRLQSLGMLNGIAADLDNISASIALAEGQVLRSMDDSDAEIGAKLDTTQLLLVAVLAVGVVSLLLSVDTRRRAGARTHPKEHKPAKEQTSEKPRN
jgi:hypothetical protein